MDGDPSGEPELDSLGRTLPLPYRVAVLVVLGIWGWGINLQQLHGLKIDVPALIRYPGRSNAMQPPPPPHHRTVYRLAAVASTGVSASLLLFWLLTRRDPARVLACDWLPMTTLAVLGLVLVLPLPRRLQQLLHGTPGVPPWALALAAPGHMPQDGRRRFAATLRRVALGGLAEPAHGKFGDVLLADVLTSYSKVLGDIFVCVCMFVGGGHAGHAASATDRPDRACGGAMAVPLIMALPFAARFRQCLIEYLRARRARESGVTHLANALKYASSFPVIVLSALQRTADASAANGQTPTQAPRLHKAWLAAVLVNSLYSFYWDVARDWDLTLFSGAARRNTPGQAWGLRRRLYLQPAPMVYYVVVVLDLVLRCSWSLKLSPHLGRLVPAAKDFESSLFLMEVLEVFRRWVWIFFRVETEWIRTMSSPVLGSTDVLLGDYVGKYDDDDDA